MTSSILRSLLKERAEDYLEILDAIEYGARKTEKLDLLRYVKRWRVGHFMIR